MKHPKLRLITEQEVPVPAELSLSENQLLSRKNCDESHTVYAKGLLGALLANNQIELRESFTSELSGRAIYLSTRAYDWALVRDSAEALCLVPLKKK